MIITLTGKPCSGKSVIAHEFSKKYNFNDMQMGEVFRDKAKKFGFNSIGELNDNEQIKLVDAEVDSYIEYVGKKQFNDNIIIVSRTAWFLIPKSFKVFLDVSLDVAANRLILDKRDSEPVKNKREAKAVLSKRWNNENARYQELYQHDNTNLKNYNLVILTDNKTIDEIVLEIYNGYKNYLKTLKK